MIENITVVSKGGLVLWNMCTYPLQGNPIDAMIKSVLLEDRLADKSFQIDKYMLKWMIDNDFGLIFVVVYQKSIPLLYVEELLEIVKQQFVKMFIEILQTSKKTNSPALLSEHKFNFDEEYSKILKAVIQRDRESREMKKQGVSMKQTVSTRLVSEKKKEEESNKNTEETSEQSETNSDQQDPSSPSNPLLVKRTSQRVMKGFQKKENGTASPKTQKGGKKETKWDELKYSESKAAALDHSEKSGTSPNDDQEKVNAFLEKFLPDASAKTDIDTFDESDYVVEKKDEKEKKGAVGRFFSSLTSGRTIEKEDLASAMEKFKENLIAKNVNTEVADQICKSVAENLEGKKIGAFTNLSSEIQRTLEQTLTRILTPKRNIDILREAMAAKEQNRPYVITFCGVNGVGKSTSLSKITFWLKQNNLSCLLAACDTYRSGAVEQLLVHAKCLGVTLYDRGYGKEISQVAKEAINEAKRKHIDVVLIDTAGRMQHNKPLMESLTKLIHLNKPDLVLFVGEALVGNDGVDQLMNFNDALSNIVAEENALNQTTLKTNLIDGVVLTKFDAIDDKVGAAISMVYKTGHPIVFVGVGQTYTDLKKLSIPAVVRSLLK